MVCKFCAEPIPDATADTVTCRSCGVATLRATKMVQLLPKPLVPWMLTIFDRMMMLGYGIDPGILEKGYVPPIHRRTAA